MLIKINEAVIVEGKYDKIKLDSIIDAPIIQTNGFAIFKDKEQMELIRQLAKKRGIVILTDSDSAGFLIRSHLSGCIPKDRIKHAYIPDVLGKEKRKERKSAEGKLGVEGVSKDIILNALKTAGVNAQLDINKQRLITKADLFDAGLSGLADSKSRRLTLLKKLKLPEHLSANRLIEVLNALLTFEEWQALINELF